MLEVWPTVYTYVLQHTLVRFEDVSNPSAQSLCICLIIAFGWRLSFLLLEQRRWYAWRLAVLSLGFILATTECSPVSQLASVNNPMGTRPVVIEFHPVCGMCS